MNLMTIIFFIIVGAMMVSMLCFGILMHKALIKHMGLVDAFLISRSAVNNGKIPEYDWKRFKRYRRMSFVSFLSGVGLVFLLIGLDACFHLFGK